MKFILAIWFSRLAAFLCKISNRPGTALPGTVALKICPDFIARAAKKIKKGIIVVCGTNGKTTTNNVINRALRLAGYKTVCNSDGANMIMGIAGSFASALTPFGKCDRDFACLETDEATLKIAFKYFKPTVIAVTNLFRDQLDRYGEEDATYRLLQSAFDMAPDATLVLNSDDPITSYFGKKRKSVRYFGISERADTISVDEIREGENCKNCGMRLKYEFYNYCQLGKFYCPNCGNTNEPAVVWADKIKAENGTLSFTAHDGADDFSLTSKTTGLYSVYNSLTALTVLRFFGIEKGFCEDAVNFQRPNPGRTNRFNVNGKTVYLILSKNPTGFNQSVTAVINDAREKDVMLILNDNAQDGRDVSWIWDVDFEAMQTSKDILYTLSGKRRYDLFLRLKYASFDTDKITVSDTVEDGIRSMLTSSSDLYYILVNYTAMQSAYDYLSSVGEEEL